MKKLYWVVGGILIVSAVFFIPDQTGDLWTSVWLSVWLSYAAALLYLVVLAWIWFKQIESKGRRMAIGIVLGLLILSSGMFGYFSYKKSQISHTRLPQIRADIERNVAKSYIIKPLLSIMETYFMPEEGQPEQQNMSSIFISKYDSLLTEDNVFQYGSEVDERSFNLYLVTAEADTIVLIGQSNVIDGQDSEFQNFDGARGKMQVRGILTPNGIDYEQQN